MEIKFYNCRLFLITLFVGIFLSSCGGGTSNDEGSTPLLQNQAPTASAGPDKIVFEKTDVTLNGAATDLDGSIANYRWSQKSGISMTLNGADTQTLRFTAPESIEEEILTFQLTVTDDKGLTATDSVHISVIQGLPELVLKQASITIPAFEGVNLDFNNLTASTTFSEQGLNSDGSSQLKFIEGSQYQLLYVTKNDGEPIAVSYTDSTKIDNNNVIITSESIAKGVILSMPLLIGYNETERLTILEKAISLNLFTDLVQEIETAIATDPENLLNEVVYPGIYEKSFLIIIDSIKNLDEESATARVATSLLTAQKTNEEIIGSVEHPHLQDVPGVNIDVVNTEFVFYGIEAKRIENIDDAYNYVGLATSRKKALEVNIELSWTPVTVNWTAPIHTPVSLDDGGFDISLTKFSFESEAGQKAFSANMFKGACILVELVTPGWCPADDKAISSIIDSIGIAPGVNDVWRSIISGSPSKALSIIVDWLQSPEGFTYLTLKLYPGADSKVTHQFAMKSALKILESASFVLKFYPLLNDNIPFFTGLALAPNKFKWCIAQNVEILREEVGCSLTEPTARIEIKDAPENLFVGHTVTFDASKSSDLEDDDASLELRWDFDNNGVFDTDWLSSPDKTYDYIFTIPGFYEVILEVKDQDGMIGRAIKSIVVRESDDHGNSISTATAITSNSVTSGILEASTDIDCFRIEIPEDGVLSLYTTGETDTVGGLTIDGVNWLVVNDDAVPGVNLNFRLTEEVSVGSYYVCVSLYSENDTGAYTLNSEFTPASSSCVLDSETGLMWERKTNDGGLRDSAWSYMNTTNMNGVDPRDTYDWGECLASYGDSSDSDDVYCHTQGFVSAVNSVGICGFNDWRMPTIIELETLVEPNQIPAIDTSKFPYTNYNPDPFYVHHWWYWSATPAGDSAAHYMYFELGISSQFGLNRQNSARVRLVRNTQ